MDADDLCALSFTESGRHIELPVFRGDFRPTPSEEGGANAPIVVEDDEEGGANAPIVIEDDEEGGANASLEDDEEPMQT